MKVMTLMRKYITSLSPKECTSIIKDSIDFISIGFGFEKFTGWILLNIFSISFSSGPIRLYNPIYNKIIGKISKKDGVTYVSIIKFKGLTDFFSIGFIFILSFIIILIASQGLLNVWILICMSLLCCLLAAIITFTFTRITIEGQNGDKRLTEFIERNLDLKVVERKDRLLANRKNQRCSSIGKGLLIVIVTLFMLICLFGILFFAGAWYKENYM